MHCTLLVLIYSDLSIILKLLSFHTTFTLIMLLVYIEYIFYVVLLTSLHLRRVIKIRICHFNQNTFSNFYGSMKRRCIKVCRIFTICLTSAIMHLRDKVFHLLRLLILLNNVGRQNVFGSWNFQILKFKRAKKFKECVQRKI